MTTITPIEELILLALVRKELYGLEIIRCVAECSGNTRELKPGSIYPTLASLERKGLVDSEWGEGVGGRRRYYCLTAAGVKAIEDAIGFRQRLIGWVPDRVN
jgi:PadR family transcriptional regulator, regulatory protein PadR